MEKFYCKIRHRGKDNKYVVGWSTKSVLTYQNCGKRGHLKRNFKSNRNSCNGGLSKTSTINLPEWVTKKPMISYVENLTTATINRNKNHYKWCTSFNEGNGVWGYHWKVDHRELKKKQVKNNLVQFSDSSTNAVIYFYYPIPPVRSMWRNKSRMGIIVRNLFNFHASDIPNFYFFNLHIVVVPLDLAWEENILELVLGL